MTFEGNGDSLCEEQRQQVSDSVSSPSINRRRSLPYSYTKNMYMNETERVCES